MKLLCLSDTHGLHERVPLDLTGVDVLIHAGDFTASTLNTKQETLDFLSWYDSLSCPRKILVAGNHDLYLEALSPKEKTKLFKAYPSIIYLEDSSITLDGKLFHGSPYTPTFYNWAFMKRDDLLDTHWDLIPLDTDVLITHGPAFGTADNVYGKQAGSLTLSDRIRQLNLSVHICGHIHEDAGVHLKNNLLTVNASILTEFYTPKTPITITI